jgi:NAD(P)-dependent dehydrogenase (short-subunit alcohol dehydrogenase family)
MSKTWFITGANRGLGNAFATAALERGDRVAATSRRREALDPLVERFGDRVVPLALDVTDRGAAFTAVHAALERLGRLDIVVNNAGTGLFGAVEEITEEQLRAQLDVNLFGPFHVLQAVLPILRRQGRGHVVQISTIGGLVSFPLLGGYHASKWALEGLTEALAQEVQGFGIRTTLVEPGPYATDWAGSSATVATPLAEYAPLHAARAAQGQQLPPHWIGTPAAAGRALLAVVDADDPPARVFFGVMPTEIVPAIYESRLRTWEAWRDVAVAANG